MVQRPRPDLRGGVRSNAHSYRNCAEPDDAAKRNIWAVTFLDFQLRVLRPLGLFGLLEFRSQHGDGGIPYDWRKTALFDRFLSFGLDVEAAAATRH